MSVISTICRATTGVIEAIDFVRELSRVKRAPNLCARIFFCASAIFKGSALGCHSAEIYASSSEVSIGTLNNIKGVETISRLGELFVAPGAVAADIAFYRGRQGVFTTADCVEIFEKGFCRPLLSLARAGLEGGVYQEKTYLAMTPEELQKESRPVYEWDGDSNVLVGERPVIREECLHNIEGFTAGLNILYPAEFLGRLSPCTHVTAGIESLLLESLRDQ